MSQNNEFAGRTLEEAAQKATAAYRAKKFESKNRGRCTDLSLEISSLKSQIGRIGDRAEHLADAAEQLQRSARVELALSALVGLGSLARGLRGLALIIRRIRNKDISRLSKRDIVDVLAALGPIGSGIAAAFAIHQLIEAQRLARQAEAVERNAEQLGELLLDAVSDYSRLGCAAARRLRS